MSTGLKGGVYKRVNGERVRDLSVKQTLPEQAESEPVPVDDAPEQAAEEESTPTQFDDQEIDDDVDPETISS